MRDSDKATADPIRQSKLLLTNGWPPSPTNYRLDNAAVEFPLFLFLYFSISSHLDFIINSHNRWPFG